MKRGFLLAVLFTAALAGVLSAGDWQTEAGRADRYYSARDYDAAWLFYERALKEGVDDGRTVFRAAESFRLQNLTRNPEFETSLYTVAYYYLQEQYPDDPEVAGADSRRDPAAVVNRSYLRKTYGAVGGKAPRLRRPVSDGLGSAAAFFSSRAEVLGSMILVFRSEGVRAGFSWIGANLGSLLFSILVLNALTGIILPVVMALTVAREGRKSYVTAYAFLFHWGPLGIHRFYLGRYISGVVWLLTGGLLGIGLFFDLFLTGAYIRFWNEDHRDRRPSVRSTSTYRTADVGEKRSYGAASDSKKPKKAKKTRTKNERAGKPAVKPDKPSRTAEKKQRDDFVPEEREGTGRVFPAVSPGFDSRTADSLSAPEPEDDFGDLSDLTFDDGDDLSPSGDSPGGSFSSGLPEELSEDDFDIKSFE